MSNFFVHFKNDEAAGHDSQKSRKMKYVTETDESCREYKNYQNFFARADGRMILFEK